MLVAANRIEHGDRNKAGQNVLVIIEAGQPVKDLPSEVVKTLQACGAVVDDRSHAAEAGEA